MTSGVYKPYSEV